MAELATPLGIIKGNEREDCLEYLGIPFAKAKRFGYAELVESLGETFDATHYGTACSQYREFFPHVASPFYYKEFRKGQTFVYGEDCLNLNIYTPKEKGTYPVVVFVHGGGFNSMCNSENYIDGSHYCKRGIIFVSINYRVGVFGYLTHEEIRKQEGRDGNFGLDDILVAAKWIKKNIASFGGDPDRITMMGQSAGAISLQYLCLSKKAEGLFARAILLSGGGCFPKMALPKPSDDTHEYWKQVIEASGVSTFDQFKALSTRDVLQAVEKVKTQRKDSRTNTMPVIDGYLIEDSVDKLIKNPLKLDYMISYTNNDMFTFILSNMAHKYAKNNDAYLYLFDVNAPGDKNQGFHSADLRYIFGTLDTGWRPYGDEDRAVSKTMIEYISSFIKTGDPNGDGRPRWEKKKLFVFSKKGARMHHRPTFKLILNTFKGDPK